MGSVGKWLLGVRQKSRLNRIYINLRIIIPLITSLVLIGVIVYSFNNRKQRWDMKISPVNQSQVNNLNIKMFGH